MKLFVKNNCILSDLCITERKIIVIDLPVENSVLKASSVHADYLVTVRK
jgi:hypothetical protein